MKKYEYVSVTDVPTYSNYIEILPHRTIIDEYAAKGYKYVGYFPTRTSDGDIKSFDLIFEKDIEDNDF